MKRVLLTGASGQVGARLSQFLWVAGYDVIGLGKREFSTGVNESYRYLSFDLLTQDIDSLIERTRPEILIHLAWETEPKTFWNSPNNHLWLNSSRKLIASFNKWGGEKIVVAGTCGEYDWGLEGPFSEASHESPRSLYGQSKLTLLNELRDQCKAFIWTRTFFQFGGKELTGRLIPSLIDSVLSGKKFTIQNPEDICDFIYIDDVVRTMFSLITTEQTGVFNVATGLGFSARDIGIMIASILDCQELLHFNHQSRKPINIRADVSKLKMVLGPISSTPIEEAIGKTIKERVSQ